MLSPKLENAFNTHLNKEIFSSYLYFSMAAYFKASSLDGFGKWMEIQGTEELSHASKFYSFINDKGGKVNLKGIAAPETSWESPMAVLNEVFQHEQLISRCINDLVNLATEEKDHSAVIFLQWFVTEQVEEEGTAEKIINKMKLLENHPGGIYLMDNELSSRTADPALLFPGMFNGQ